MNNKWIIEPIDEEEVIGWNVIDTTFDSPDDYNSVAVVLVNNNIEESKSNAALISTAPELLVACKRALNYLNKNLPLYDEIQYLINKADGLEGDIETLSYFDDVSEMYNDSVLNLDFKENKCSFVTNAKMSEFFSFKSCGNDTGLILLNISGDFMYDEEFDDSYLRYPIGHLISKSVYKDYISFMSNKYSDLASFMNDFDSQDSDISLRAFISDMFFNEFAPMYIREMSLFDYLKKYPLMVDNGDVYLSFNLPKFLENCPYAMHPDVEVNYNGQSIQGVLLYRDKDDKFFVYNQEQKAAAFFMIPNNDISTQASTLKFIDLIQK